MSWQEQLISLYLFICKEYAHYLNGYCLRMSNYVSLTITDEEILTIYLFGLMSRQQKLTEIHDYALRHLKDWFPTLPSYVGFVQRIDRLQDVFIPLIEHLQARLPMDLQQTIYQLTDSMPIIMAHEEGDLVQR